MKEKGHHGITLKKLLAREGVDYMAFADTMGVDSYNYLFVLDRLFFSKEKLEGKWIQKICGRMEWDPEIFM